MSTNRKLSPNAGIFGVIQEQPTSRIKRKSSKRKKKPTQTVVKPPSPISDKPPPRI